MKIFKLEPNEDGTFSVVYEWVVHRFLLDDGSTIDVRAPYDDSVLREAVRKHTGAKAINGVAYVSDEPKVETAPIARKVPRKKVGHARGAA